jgi:hypothetical protein
MESVQVGDPNGGLVGDLANALVAALDEQGR